MVKLNDKHIKKQYYYVLVFSTFVKLGVTKCPEKRRLSNLRRFKDRGDAQYSLVFKISNTWDKEAIEDEWKLEFKEYNIGIECGSTRQEICYECYEREHLAKYYSELLDFAKKYNFEIVTKVPNPTLYNESDEGLDEESEQESDDDDSESEYEPDEESEGESEGESDEEEDARYQPPVVGFKRNRGDSSRSSKRPRRN